MTTNLISCKTAFALVVVLAYSLTVSPSHTSAQPIIIDGFGGRVMRVAPATTADKTKPSVDEDHLFPESATLKTDPDVERMMRRAQDFTDRQKWDVAMPLWQKVLDSSGSELTTKPQWIRRRKGDELNSQKNWLQTYKSVRTEVESLLAKLPDEGLTEYRKAADASARGLIASAQGDREEVALAEVARRYFISSLGDDAAYRLGCLLLDRHDFVGAARLFDKILAQHPDPSMPREDVLLRLAVASARSGDRTGGRAAMHAISLLKNQGTVGISDGTLTLVDRDVRKDHIAIYSSGQSDGDWRMALGTPARDGFMAPLPADALHSKLSETWAYAVKVFDLQQLQTLAQQGRRTSIQARRGMYVEQATTVETPPSRPDLLTKWKEQKWLPTSQALIHKGRLIFKTYTRVVCLDTNSIGQPKVVWKAPPGGFLAADGKLMDDEDVDAIAEDLKDWARRSVVSVRASDEPTDYRSVALFGDRTLQSMSLVGNWVLFIDDAPQLKGDSDPRLAAARAGGTAEKSKTRCTLLAVDVNSGKLQWKWPRDDDAEKPADDFRILAAPVPHRDLMIVPIFSGGAVYLYALQPTQSTLPGGKTIHNVKLAWKSLLCEEPQSGANRWAPVGLCVDSGDVYVASGRGVVYAVEAASGSIRWAVRYPRDMSRGSQPSPNHFGPPVIVPASMRGWSENYIIARGSSILVLPSDARRAIALSRGSGDFQWELVGLDERLNYVLGVQGENLYLGGPSGVRCYSIAAQGRTVWEHDLNSTDDKEVSHGRGVLTADAIYLPVKDRVYRLALENRGAKGQVVARSDVAFASDGEDPVGNLISDGKGLYSVGPERVFALGSVNRQMALLDQRIAAGDSSLRNWRMLLHGRMGKFDAAVEDLNIIYSEASTGGPVKGLAAMLTALEQLKLAENAPLMALALLAGPKGALEAIPADERQALSPAVGAGIAQHVGIALDKLRKAPSADAAPLLLRFIEIWPDRALRRMAERALSDSATADHVKLLRDAIAGGSEPVRIAAIDALAKVLGDRAPDEMASLVKHASPGVQFAASRSLAQAGDRRALAPLVALLESDDASVRHDSIRLLQALTGERRGYLPHVESADERKTALAAWRGWLETDGPKAKLNHPLKYVHRTLVTDFQRGRLIEFDAEGQQTWVSDSVPGAFACQGLVGGNRLVACYQHRRVFEIDPKGTIVWKSDHLLPIYPQAIQRLDNGNTLVSGSDMSERGGMVFELDREGRTVPGRTITLTSPPSDARRLPNGNTLVTLSQEGRVAELSPSGTTVTSGTLTGLTNPISARRLANGNTLVCELDRPSRRGFRDGRETIEGASRVTEYGPRNEPKEIVWTKTDGFFNVTDAERLDNGHTLILDQRGLRQIDQQGQEVWSKQISGTRRLSVYME